jgi:hypothetical protein
MGEVGVRVRGERDREFHGLFIFFIIKYNLKDWVVVYWVKWVKIGYFRHFA